jgi:transposase
MTPTHPPSTDRPIHTLGIDLAKDTLIACLFDHTGAEIRPPTEFHTSPAGLRRLLAWLPDPASTRVVFESTGVYGKPLIFALHGLVASLHQLNPQIVKRLAASCIQTKTDHADARAIARVGHRLALTEPRALDNARVSYDPRFEDLALWLNEFHRLSLNAATLKTQIQTIQHNPAPAAKQLLKRLQRELQLTDKHKKQAAELMDQAADHADARSVELLASIPGIGRATAATLLSRIVSIQRFDSADALKGYLGVYARRVQSGRHEAPSRMARHGCKLVRHMLWNCAKVAARFNPDCKALFQRLKDKGKHAASCYGAVARKLLHIVYGVLKNQKPYQPALLNT